MRYSKTSLDRFSRDPLYFAVIAEKRYCHFLDFPRMTKQMNTRQYVINDQLQITMHHASLSTSTSLFRIDEVEEKKKELYPYHPPRLLY